MILHHSNNNSSGLLLGGGEYRRGNLSLKCMRQKVYVLNELSYRTGAGFTAVCTDIQLHLRFFIFLQQ